MNQDRVVARRNSTARIAALAAMAALLAPALLTAQATMPQTPAGQRLGELFKAIDGDDKAKEALVQKSYAKQMRERRPLEEHLRVLKSIQQNLGGFEIAKIEKSAPNEIVAQATARANGMTFYIDLTTEEAAPHGIARLAIDTNPPGSRPAEPGKAVKKQQP